ncbi:MAG: hypothetical protein JXA45_03170 [Methanomassiliicoccales archaeon]|nr:hypothetical protein [Methanomassiliicoccales archaeon]
MHYPEAKRPASVTVLFAFLTLFGFLGIVSGAMLMADPSGESMGFTSELLENMPFNSFLPVGLFLFFVYGIGGLLLAYGSLTRKELFLEAISERSGLHWSWTGGVLMMLTLIIWLAVEGTLIGLDFAATYFTISIGAVISVMLTMPATRGYLKVRS